MNNISQRVTFENVSNKIPLSIEAMLSLLTEMTKGWPKIIAGTLCYQKNGEIHPLSSATALFAWIDQYAAVSWKRGAVTKEEFYEGLLQRIEKFEWTSPYPHFPKIEGVYYTCTYYKARKNGTLDELVDRFNTETCRDRELLKAMIMTLYWGGPPGRRPAFVITSDPEDDPQRGRGVGKTALVEMLSKLIGGSISVRPNTSQDRVISGMLSPASWSKRIALIDNLKTYRMSNDMIESLVTLEQINGHRLHHGFAMRPNHLIWVITVNGASLSKDMAQRSVVIKLSRPEMSGTWYSETVAFIEANRFHIETDVRWNMEKPATPIAELDRWADWGNDIVSRLDHPQELLDNINSRRAEIDDDDQDAANVIDHFRACISREIPDIDLDTARVKIGTLELGKWLMMLKPGMSMQQASQYLRQLQLPRLKYARNSNSRFYIWIGIEAEENAIPYEISYKVIAGRR